VTRAEVTRLAAEDGLCRVETNEEIYAAQAVIVASGTKPVEWKDVEIPERARSRIFYEVYPIHEVAGQVVVVVGAGDVAVDYALTLARENRVVLLNRGTTAPCLLLLMNRMQATQGIRYYPKSRITGISSDGVGELSIEAAGLEGKIHIVADYLLLAIGRAPQLDFLAEPDARDLVEQGRVHIVGDAKNGGLRQTAIAVGDGVGAAMKIARMLRGGAA
jgi:thioredoxin reductase